MGKIELKNQIAEQLLQEITNIKNQETISDSQLRFLHELTKLVELSSKTQHLTVVTDILSNVNKLASAQLDKNKETQEQPIIKEEMQDIPLTPEKEETGNKTDTNQQQQIRINDEEESDELEQMLVDSTEPKKEISYEKFDWCAGVYGRNGFATVIGNMNSDSQEYWASEHYIYDPISIPFPGADFELNWRLPQIGKHLNRAEGGPPNRGFDPRFQHLVLRVPGKDINRLAIKGDPILHLENGKDLFEAINESNYYDKRVYASVLLPTVPEEYYDSKDKEDMEFMKILYDFYGILFENMKVPLPGDAITIKPNTLEELVSLARILNKSNIIFRTTEGGKGIHRAYTRNFQNEKRDRLVLYINTMVSEKDGLNLDMKNGLSSKENISKFQDYLEYGAIPTILAKVHDNAQKANDNQQLARIEEWNNVFNFAKEQTLDRLESLSQKKEVLASKKI